MPLAFVSEENRVLRESRIRLFPSLGHELSNASYFRRRFFGEKFEQTAFCEWRERNDLSQSEAAIKLRVSKRSLQEWEQGRGGTQTSGDATCGV